MIKRKKDTSGPVYGCLQLLIIIKMKYLVALVFIVIVQSFTANGNADFTLELNPVQGLNGIGNLDPVIDSHSKTHGMKSMLDEDVENSLRVSACGGDNNARTLADGTCVCKNHY